jgi:hypothetical protein
MSGSDIYNNTAIPSGDWSSSVVYTAGDPATVTPTSLDAGTASLSGTVSQAGDLVVFTVTAVGGGTFQEQLQAVCDIDGGSVFVDGGGNYYLFADAALASGRSYSATSGFGNFSGTLHPPACFAERTRIETDRGPVPVEQLRPGDRVRTYRRPGFAPVVWTGQRQVVCAQHRAQDIWPVRIAAGAVAEGQPSRDLYLSPDHSVFLDGVLVPVRHLLNDATIVQVPADRITYWHVELIEHDILLADGLPTESYLDTGNRAGFAGSRPPLGVVRGGARTAWAERACARLLEDPARQASIRLRLRQRATALGFRETPDAGLSLRAEGRPIHATWDGTTLEAVLPGGLRMVHLHSRTAVPSQQLPGAEDHRRLGVAVVQVLLDGWEFRLDDGRLLAGWHPPEPNLRWTDGLASLVLPPTPKPIHLRIRTAPMLRYWHTVFAEQPARAA